MENNYIRLKVKYKDETHPIKLGDRKRTIHELIESIITSLNTPAKREDGSIREGLNIQHYDRNGMPVVFRLSIETTDENGKTDEKKLSEQTPDGNICYTTDYEIKDGVVLVLDSKLIPG